MIYTVTKTTKGWAVIAPTGTKLDVKPTKKAAKVLAAVLAGWRGKVVFA